jgi:hypothetical protein
MNNPTLQYYMHDGPSAFRFELAGYLNQEGARRLDQDWRTASSVIGDRTLLVDVTFVTHVDEHGRELITRWHRDGARLIANSKASRALAESIVGERALNEDDEPASDRTWLPFSCFIPRERQHSACAGHGYVFGLERDTRHAQRSRSGGRHG